MKKITLFSVIAMLLVNSQVIDTNVLDGPNNVVEYGQDNNLHGKDNVVGGYRNDIHGNSNNAHGDDNDLIGNNNHVDGHANLVEGGGNLVSGAGNIVLGPQASQADRQAVVSAMQQRMQQIFGQRNLQFIQ